jgi:serine O-acetyltransferase
VSSRPIQPLLWCIRADLYREGGACGFGTFLRKFFFSPGFNYCVWMRICGNLHSRPITRYTLFLPALLALKGRSFKYGIDIPYRTRIGYGFYIGHFGGIVVHPNAVIGNNCNISQGVTIGRANRGARAGTPVIGDNVFIGPGAKIIGNLQIGNNVAIGANAVVTKSVPDNAVVAGVPAHVISMQGSTRYVEHTDYPAC